jgi:hypothetical protein
VYSPPRLATFFLSLATRRSAISGQFN